MKRLKKLPGYLRATSRLAIGFAVIGALAAYQLLMGGPLLKDRKTTPRIFGKVFSKLMGVKLNYDFNKAAIHRPAKGDRPTIYIANHMSYLDMAVLSSMIDGAYVAQHGVAKMPVIGRICRSLGTIFANRDGRHLKSIQENVVKTLNKGRNIILFPEGRTARGDKVLKFKGGALGVMFNNVSDVPLETDVLVQPFAMKISRIGGEDISAKPELLDHYSWYGGKGGMLKHAWDLLQSKKTIEMELKSFEVVDPADYGDRKEFLQAMEDIIRSGVVTATPVPAS